MREAQMFCTEPYIPWQWRARCPHGFLIAYPSYGFFWIELYLLLKVTYPLILRNRIFIRSLFLGNESRKKCRKRTRDKSTINFQTKISINVKKTCQQRLFSKRR